MHPSLSNLRIGKANRSIYFVQEATVVKFKYNTHRLTNMVTTSANATLTESSSYRLTCCRELHT